MEKVALLLFVVEELLCWVAKCLIGLGGDREVGLVDVGLLRAPFEIFWDCSVNVGLALGLILGSSATNSLPFRLGGRLGGRFVIIAFAQVNGFRWSSEYFRYHLFHALVLLCCIIIREVDTLQLMLRLASHKLSLNASRFVNCRLSND